MMPARVAAGPPAEIVVPAIESAEESGVKNWPATVITPVAQREWTIVLGAK